MTSTIRALTCIAAAALLGQGCRQQAAGNTLTVSGHVEATDVQVSPEVGGRVVELRVAEGDRVARGDPIARLDTSDTVLQLQRAHADRDSAAAQLRLLEAGARTEDVRRAEAQAAAARSDVASIDADLKAAELDLQRYESLLRANAGSQKQRDDAKARVDAARARQQAAADRVRAADEAVAVLRAGARRQEIDAARARVAAVEAQIAMLEKNLRDADVAAPVGGTVTQKLHDVGELLAPRTPIVVITDLDHAWANLFVPEPMVPRLKIGDAARVLTDAGQSVAGTITFISPKAEFTPRNVQTAEERSKLVYRIKVTVDNRSGVLKPGMPVDAEIGLK
jgi:HlyD family secretion protein